jgi:MFS family permease
MWQMLHLLPADQDLNDMILGMKKLIGKAKAPTTDSWLHGIQKYHLLVFVCCWLGGIFDGMDSSLMSVALPSAIGELIGTSDKLAVSQIGSYVSAIFLIGWMLGGILFGFIGDKLGRVQSMIFSILLYAAFTGLAGLVHNWPQLAICRFLTGLGIGGELVSIATFLTEVWPERSRAIAVGALITSYQAGVFLAGSVSFLFNSWRTVFFVGAVPALLVIVLRLTLKESDRWLQDRDHRLTLSEEKSQLQALFVSHQARSLLVGGLAFGALLIGYWASLSWIPTWVQSLLSTSGGQERGLVTMCQGFAAILGCTASGFFCDWLGRKKTLLFAFLGCFAASWLLFTTNQTFTTTVYLETGFLGFFIGLAQATLYIYLPELFATRVRATGTGFCLNVGRLVTVVAVFFVGTLVAILGGYAKAAYAFSFAYLIGAVTSFWGFETKGQVLPE